MNAFNVIVAGIGIWLAVSAVVAGAWVIFAGRAPEPPSRGGMFAGDPNNRR